MEHQQAALRKAIAAMSAFTDPEGNMPADTGEFRDLKEALSDCEAALLTMPDDALNRDCHQCCGKSQGEAELEKVEQQLAGAEAVRNLTVERYQGTISQLSTDLFAANRLLTIAMQKLGGVLDVSPEDYINVEKAGAIQAEADPVTKHFVLRLVEQHPGVQ